MISVTKKPATLSDCWSGLVVPTACIPCVVNNAMQW